MGLLNFIKRLVFLSQNIPQQTAYVFKGKEVSYRELYQKVRKFAYGLKKQGFKEGDRLVLFTWNNPYFLITYYAAIFLGMIVTPINPRYTAREVLRIVSHSEAKALITDGNLLRELLPFMSKSKQGLTIIYHSSQETIQNLLNNTHSLKSFNQLMEENPVSLQPVNVEQDQPAVMLYTSGTTGEPKGAILTYKNLYHGAKDHTDFLAVNKNDRILVTLPLNHVFGMTVSLNGPIYRGATLLLVEKFSPKKVFAIAKKHQATIFAGVPTMYNYLMQADLPIEEKQKSFQHLRFALSGGATLSLSLLSNFESTFKVPVLEGYGLTEAAPVTFNQNRLKRRKGSIGLGLPNLRLRVTTNKGEDVPPGEVGELCIKGPVVMKEYFKNGEETRAVLKDGWLRTGDIAKIDTDGFVYIVDRSKDVIIVKGHNVYPSEVEEVLYQHPAISEVTVIGKKINSIEETVVAFVVLKKGYRTTDEELLEFTQKYLATYKCPSSIVFLEELPKNVTGKIDKNRLRKDYIQHR